MFFIRKNIVVYVEWAWFVFKVFWFLWLTTFIVRPFLSYNLQGGLSGIDAFILDMMAKIPVMFSSMWFASATILYFVGNFFILLLLLAAILVFGYSVLMQAVNFNFSINWFYRLIANLVQDKVAWSSTTTVVGSTVAIGHMWKLNLDKKAYFEKKEKEFRERYEQQRLRRPG